MTRPDAATMQTLRPAALAALVVALALRVGNDAVAQNPPLQKVPAGQLDSIGRHVEFMAPRSGPPGTKVTLRSAGMPSLTPLRIGMGAVHFGFEETGQVLTNEKGEFSIEVTVPRWARRDLTHRFIVFDFYFVPIALSDVFFVTDSTGALSRQGELVNARPPCPVLRGDDGVRYALAGDLAGFKAGSHVVVEGTISPSSTCEQSATIAVARISAAER